MKLECVKVGSLKTNCYILELNGKVIVIDPGADFYLIKRYLMDKTVVAVLITHGHDDHTSALDNMIDYYHPNVYSHNNLSEGKMSIEGFNFEVIYTPGHTSDSVSYYFYEYRLMFVGDFIFKGTVGRMDMPTGSMIDMRNSLRKIYNYDERIKLFPGHGEETYLRDEKRLNQYFIKWVEGTN